MSPAKLALILFCATASLPASAQDSPGQPHPNNYFQLAPRVGYDFPAYGNNTPYIGYKGGLAPGISADYYLGWIGLGADVDYIKNAPRSTYPDTDLYDALYSPIVSPDLMEDNITRLFAGIGPSFKIQTSDRKWVGEGNLRGGPAWIDGGQTLLEDTKSGEWLNFHAGYEQAMAWSGKAQLRFGYFFNDLLGVHIGGYYMRHFGAEEANIGGLSAKYYPFGSIGNLPGNVVGTAPLERAAPCPCDISSFGVFAGLSLRLSFQQREKPPKEIPETLSPAFSLIVTARDKYSGELLPNTDIALVNSAGEIVKTGVTNSFGVAEFSIISRADYTVKGNLLENALEPTPAYAYEFRNDAPLQKEILYSDRNFIIKGKAFVCNSSVPLPGVSIFLENKEKSFKKSTLTDDRGEFSLQLPESSIYQLYGKKQSFFSQTEEVDASDYDRDESLFVRLEICAEKVECGKAIRLNNILYDLNKYFIREDAKPELNKLAQFLLDNPDVKVELNSHTDSRGSFDYNLELSQNRANAAVEYIVSRGISASRVTAKGYGESFLLNHCAEGVNCTEAEHQVNRRTEFRVICPK